MTAPEQPYEPLTPVQSEQILHSLGRATRDAPRQIKAARDVLVAARKAVTSAKGALTVAAAKATLSPRCPIVGRGPGEVSVAERNSWVVMQTLAEREAVDDAVNAATAAAAVLAAAEDNRKSLREQNMIATSMNASVRDAYRGPTGSFQ